MCRLIEHRAAALGRVEIFRTTRAVKVVRVVYGVDHADAAKVATRYEIAHSLNGRIEGVTMADNHVHAGAPRGIHDCAALIEREGHWLFDQEVFAVLGRKRGVPYVVLMRGRHINRLDSRISAQLLDGRVAPGGKVRGKLTPRFRSETGSRHERDSWVGNKGRHHHVKCAAETGYAETEPTFACAGHRQGPSPGFILDI